MKNSMYPNLRAISLYSQSIINQISKLAKNIENESCSTTWVDPKTVVEPYPNPKNSPLGPQKVKLIQKLSQNQMSEFHIENESCSTTLVDPKTVFEPFYSSKNSPLGPQKEKITPKLSQIQISELKEIKKMKVVQIHD